MRSPQVLSLLVVVLLLASSSASVIEDTCRRFDGADIYDICIKFFKANKDSATTDKCGLAVIAIGIASATAVDTRKRVATLKAEEKDQIIQHVLAYCDNMYSRAVGLFDKAARGISSGRLGDAVTSLSSALDIPKYCDDKFLEAGVKSPFDAENGEFELQCAITLGVTKMLTM
ncbi:Putative invertase inhibitor [Triticum urartu]|uniref:Putative invertase inhibitor n=1 Tax=Triticum urartu TaxID=4572 RepID=M7YS16_TRIUA|nr:Putative invertase inhibitor [Triticum urartu]